jgi:hypothetical protein
MVTNGGVECRSYAQRCRYVEAHEESRTSRDYSGDSIEGKVRDVRRPQAAMLLAVSRFSQHRQRGRGRRDHVLTHCERFPSERENGKRGRCRVCEERRSVSGARSTIACASNEMEPKRTSQRSWVAVSGAMGTRALQVATKAGCRIPDQNGKGGLATGKNPAIAVVVRLMSMA